MDCILSGHNFFGQLNTQDYLHQHSPESRSNKVLNCIGILKNSGFKILHNRILNLNLFPMGGLQEKPFSILQ
jgi:hypothetical protein